MRRPGPIEGDDDWRGRASSAWTSASLAATGSAGRAACSSRSGTRRSCSAAPTTPPAPPPPRRRCCRRGRRRRRAAAPTVGTATAPSTRTRQIQRGARRRSPFGRAASRRRALMLQTELELLAGGISPLSAFASCWSARRASPRRRSPATPRGLAAAPDANIMSGMRSQRRQGAGRRRRRRRRRAPAPARPCTAAGGRRRRLGDGRATTTTVDRRRRRRRRRTPTRSRRRCSRSRRRRRSRASRRRSRSVDPRRRPRVACTTRRRRRAPDPPLVMSSDVNNRRQSMGRMGPARRCGRAGAPTLSRPRRGSSKGFGPRDRAAVCVCARARPDSGASVSGLFDQMASTSTASAPRSASSSTDADGFAGMGGETACRGRRAERRRRGGGRRRRGSDDVPLRQLGLPQAVLRRRAAGGICHAGAQTAPTTRRRPRGEAARDKAIAAMMAKKRDAFEQRVPSARAAADPARSAATARTEGCRKRHHQECSPGRRRVPRSAKPPSVRQPGVPRGPRSRDTSLIPVAGGRRRRRRHPRPPRVARVARVLRLERLARQPRVDPPELEHVPSRGMAGLRSPPPPSPTARGHRIDGTSPPDRRAVEPRVFAAAAAASCRARTAGPWGGERRRAARRAAPWRRPPRPLPARLHQGRARRTPAAAPRSPRDAARRDGEGARARRRAIGSTGVMPPSRPAPRPRKARRGGAHIREGRRRQGRQGRRHVAARAAAAAARVAD